MGEMTQPRKTPCASCPYRQSVPSGVWSKDEYEKLPRYDGDIPEQSAIAVFMCHQQDQSACAGWLGHRDPSELLAVRLGVVSGQLDPAALDYTTTVPLFDSGAAAAAHGVAELRRPGAKALDVIEKLSRRPSIG